jgi:hypothetical protein
LSPDHPDVDDFDLQQAHPIRGPIPSGLEQPLRHVASAPVVVRDLDGLISRDQRIALQYRRAR